MLRFFDATVPITIAKFQWGVFKKFIKGEQLNNVDNEVDGSPPKNVVTSYVGYYALLAPFLKYKNAPVILGIISTILTGIITFFWTWQLIGLNFAILATIFSCLLPHRIVHLKLGFVPPTANLLYTIMFVITTSLFNVTTLIGYKYALIILGIFLLSKYIAWELFYAVFRGSKSAVAIFVLGGIAFTTTALTLSTGINWAFLPIGFFASLMVITYLGYIHNAVSICLLVSIASLNGLFNGIVPFLIGAIIPFALVEGYYRLLKRKGYPHKTYIQLLTNFVQNKIPQLGKKTNNHGIKWWEFLNVMYHMDGTLATVYTFMGVVILLLNATIFNVVIAGMFLYGLFAWLFAYNGRSTRYFYNHLYPVMPLLLATTMVNFHWGFQIILTIFILIKVVSHRWMFKESAFDKSVKWIKQRRQTKVVGACYYSLLHQFGKGNVVYSPKSKRDIIDLVDKGYLYMIVDYYTDLSLHENQFEVLEWIQRNYYPIVEFIDETFSYKILKRLNMGETVTTKLAHKFMGNMRDNYRDYVKIYNLENIALDLQ